LKVPDTLNTVLVAVYSTAVMSVLFWLISRRLGNPEGKNENLRNFHCAHPPQLLNKEAKCEAYYPIISELVTQPLIVIVVT
jgi:hypothetical protein